MASISPVGSFSLPAEQPIRRQAARSITATENELTSKQKQIDKKTYDQQTANQQTTSQPTRGQQSSESSEQIKEASREKKQSFENKEQQKFEAAQQEAQRAEFTQQAGIVRETEPNDVRPPSSIFEQSAQDTNQELTPVVLMRDDSSSENTAINTFNQFQNIDAPPRQGQALNKFV
jgi:hypothetical protein